jgi:hypothetical protein
MAKTRSSREDVAGAASLMGKRSWRARLKKYGPKKMKKIFSAAGKKAAEQGVSGRPRLPDDQVKPNTLYQRARREKLRFKKGGHNHA